MSDNPRTPLDIDTWQDAADALSDQLDELSDETLGKALERLVAVAPEDSAADVAEFLRDVEEDVIDGLAWRDDTDAGQALIRPYEAAIARWDLPELQLDLAACLVSLGRFLSASQRLSHCPPGPARSLLEARVAAACDQPETAIDAAAAVLEQSKQDNQDSESQEQVQEQRQDALRLLLEQINPKRQLPLTPALHRIIMAAVKDLSPDVPLLHLTAAWTLRQYGQPADADEIIKLWTAGQADPGAARERAEAVLAQFGD